MADSGALQERRFYEELTSRFLQPQSPATADGSQYSLPFRFDGKNEFPLLADLL